MQELEPIQEKTLKLFAKSELVKKFYWTGGTLLAYYYLHHRMSEDIDLFSDEPFVYRDIAPFIHSLKKPLGLVEVKERKIYDRWEFLLKNKENLRVEFVFYEFPKLCPRKKWQGISIDSMDDMAANKTVALFERFAPKDVVDIYFLLIKKNYKIEQLLKLANKKFGLAVDKSSFLSEAMKACRNLDELKPLLIADNGKKQQEIIDEIRKYFVSLSSRHLNDKLT